MSTTEINQVLSYLTNVYLCTGAVSPTPIPPDELKRMEKSPDPSDRSRPSTADSKKGILRPSSRSSSGGRRSRSNSGKSELLHWLKSCKAQNLWKKQKLEGKIVRRIFILIVDIST